MTREELINKVNFILENNEYKELQLFGFIANNDNVFRISISEDLESELIDVVASGIRNLIVDKEYDIVAFSSADERKDKYYQYDLEDLPERMEQMSLVVGNHNVEGLDLQNHSIDEINTLIMLLSDGGVRTFTIYKVLTPVEKIVKTSKQVWAKFGIGENFLTEETSPMLRIGPRFQILYVSDGNSYIFVDSSTVEGQFKLNQVLKNEADRKINIIESKHLVKDINKLKHYAETPAFCRKLVKVLKKSKVIENNIPKDRILDFITNDEELRGVLKITSVEGERFIDIRNQKSAKCFLDLLNDEFVYSSLTNQKYQAVDKDER